MATIVNLPILGSPNEIRNFDFDFTPDIGGDTYVISAIAIHTPPTGGAVQIPTVGAIVDNVVPVRLLVPIIGNHTLDCIAVYSDGQQSQIRLIIPVSFMMVYPYVPPPVITSSQSASGLIGVSFSYSITATNSPTSYTATNLPTGLTINTATGLISGAPVAAGNTTFTVMATNVSGTGSATVSLSVQTNTNWADPVAGNDTTGTGSFALPYATLAKAYAVATTNINDTINLKSGTFPDVGLSWSKSGITVRAGNGFTPIFTTASSYAPIAWTLQSGNVYRAVYAPSITSFSAWHGEQRLTLQTSIVTVQAVSNSYWADTAAHFIYVNVGGGSPPNTVYDCHTGQGVFNSFTGTSIILNGLTFKWCDNGTLAFAGTITASTCIFNHFGSYPLYLAGTTGAVISNCTFTDGTNTNTLGQITDWINVLSPSTGTYSVSNSTFTRSRHGINFNIAGTLNVSDCTFTQCGAADGQGQGDGIVTNAVAATVNCTRVTFIDCVHGMVRVDTAGSTLTCKFCIGYLTGNVINNPGWGFIVDAGAVGMLYHCTAAYLDRNTSGGGGTGFLFQTNASGNVVKNCIAAHCKKGYDAGGSTPGFIEDYNDNFANSVSAGSLWGPGAHDLTSDPLFTNPLTNDFHLQAGSPLLGAGVAIAGVNDGATGFDIGRYVRGLS